MFTVVLQLQLQNAQSGRKYETVQTVNTDTSSSAILPGDKDTESAVLPDDKDIESCLW